MPRDLIHFVHKGISYKAFLAGILISFLVYISYLKGHISSFGLSYGSLFIIPVIFFCLGRIVDYRRTQTDIIYNMDVQDTALFESLLSVQKLNEDLQKKIDERVMDLKRTNEELSVTLKELVRTSDEMFSSERTAAIGDLAAGMAHELNNPMGAIRNIIQDVLEDTKGDDQFRSHLQLAELSTGRAKRIVSDFLAFSYDEEFLSIMDIDVNILIDETVNYARDSIFHSKIKVKKEFEEKLPRIKIDSILVRQVFMNIIMNANDAMEGTGRISVKTYRDGDYINVEIADTGTGISKENLGKIFDPFFSTKDKGVRKGMGLSICSSIISRLKGNIDVKSKLGVGTTFTISLPLDS